MPLHLNTARQSWNAASQFGGAELNQDACAEIRSWPGYAPTPLILLDGVARECRIGELWYKDEASRFGLGSFKALGGAYAVLRVLQKTLHASSAELRSGIYSHITHPVTVTTATDGNHGRSVAWGAHMFGCRCVVYIPKQCSAHREQAIRSFGARAVRTRQGYDDTVRQCALDAGNHGWTVVSDTSWPGYQDIPRDVMSGYALIAEEVLGQIACPTHVFVQAGVGGLAAALLPRFQDARFIIVEPEGAACLYASAVAGKLISAPPPVHTVMAGLDCAEPSLLAWNIISAGAAAFQTVSDDVTGPCMRLLARSGIVAGESAIAGFAGLLQASAHAGYRAALGLDGDSRVLVIGTEGNTDPQLYARFVPDSDMIAE